MAAGTAGKESIRSEDSSSRFLGTASGVATDSHLDLSSFDQESTSCAAAASAHYDRYSPQSTAYLMAHHLRCLSPHLAVEHIPSTRRGATVANSTVAEPYRSDEAAPESTMLHHLAAEHKVALPASAFEATGRSS